jgi:hypothetical protein
MEKSEKKLKRYVIQSEMYVYAENDKKAIKSAEKILEKIDSTITIVCEQPFGTLESRKVDFKKY